MVDIRQGQRESRIQWAASQIVRPVRSHSADFLNQTARFLQKGSTARKDPEQIPAKGSGVPGFTA